jgi:hypothetical protein
MKEKTILAFIAILFLVAFMLIGKKEPNAKASEIEKSTFDLTYNLVTTKDGCKYLMFEKPGFNSEFKHSYTCKNPEHNPILLKDLNRN